MDEPTNGMKARTAGPAFVIGLIGLTLAGVLSIEPMPTVLLALLTSVVAGTLSSGLWAIGALTAGALLSVPVVFVIQFGMSVQTVVTSKSLNGALGELQSALLLAVGFALVSAVGFGLSLLAQLWIGRLPARGSNYR